MLADECTDILTIEELSLAFRWVENGLPVEYFIELLPLKKADANTIYETLIDFLKKKELIIGNMIGMGFDGVLADTIEFKPFKKEFTLLNFCTLSLPSLTIGLCSSC